MADNNDALFREVDEELRREQMEKLWKTYGTYILAGAALIIALVGGKQYWDQRTRAAIETAGAQYESAVALLKDGKADDAAKELGALSVTGPKGYATLADLQLAGSHVKAGRTAEALAIFEKLSTTAADPMLANFARLQAAALTVGETSFDDLKTKLADLTADTSPWRSAARELLGTAAFKAGNLDEAKKLFTSIMGDASTPRETIERINMLLTAVNGAELAKTAASAPAASPAPTTPPAAESAPAK